MKVIFWMHRFDLIFMQLILEGKADIELTYGGPVSKIKIVYLLKKVSLPSLPSTKKQFPILFERSNVTTLQQVVKI